MSQPNKVNKILVGIQENLTRMLKTHPNQPVTLLVFTCLYMSLHGSLHVFTCPLLFFIKFIILYYSLLCFIIIYYSLLFFIIIYYSLLFFIIIYYSLLFFIATSVRHRPSLPEMVFPHPLSLSANPEMTIDSGIGPGERIMHRILFLNLGRLAPKMVAGMFVRFSAHWWWVPFCLDFRAMSSGQHT